MLPRPFIPEPMPVDLEALAMGESEAWAQDQVKRVLNDLYAEHKDWTKVRAVFAPPTGTLS
jgi:hypothetical protein